MNSEKIVQTAAAGAMFLATLFGAFGAHGLEATLEASGHVKTWQTAVLYQLVHGLALLAIGIWLRLEIREKQPTTLVISAMFWLAGILLFSGSLYIRSLGGPVWLWPVTPLGGICFLVGWLTLAIGVMRKNRRGDSHT